MRPLSPIERLWLVAESLAPPFAIEIVVEGPPPAGIEQAVHAATQVNPGVRGRLEGWLAGCRWVDGGGPIPVQHVQSPYGPGPQRTDPLESVDVTVHPNAVVFRGRHALVDGRGLLHFAEDTWRSLRGEPLRGSDPLSSELVLARESGVQAVPYPPERHGAVTGLHQGGETVVWGRRTVPAPFPRLLPRVMAAVIAQARAHQPGVPVCLHVPVDLRREGERTVANRTGMLFVDEMGLDTVRERRHEAVGWIAAQAPLRHVPLPLLRWGGRIAANRSITRSRFGATAVVSNMGRVAIESFDAPGARASSVFMVPPGTGATAAFLSLTGFGDRIEIVAVLPEGLASDGRLEALLDRLVECREQVS